MARKRSINPAFWENDKPAEVCRDARLLYIALFNNADDDGRLPGSARRNRGMAFRFDRDVDDAAVEGWLRALTAAELILRWELDGEAYIQIPEKTWKREQKMNYHTNSKLPPYNAEKLILPGDAFFTDAVLTQDLRSTDTRSVEECSVEESRGERKEKDEPTPGQQPPADGSDNPPLGWPTELSEIPEHWRGSIKQPVAWLNAAKRACPHIDDIPAEIRTAVAWTVANPHKQKKRWGGFLMNWLKNTEIQLSTNASGLDPNWREKAKGMGLI